MNCLKSKQTGRFLTWQGVEWGGQVSKLDRVPNKDVPRFEQWIKELKLTENSKGCGTVNGTVKERNSGKWIYRPSIPVY